MTLVVLGASGHAREVAEVIGQVAARDPSWGHLAGMLDDRPELHGKLVGGHTVLSGIAGYQGRGVRAVLGVGYPETKHRVLKIANESGFDWPILVHPRSELGSRVTLGRGVFIQAGCVITCDVDIGDFVTLNVSATVSHDVRIGDLATLSPGVHLGGCVTVEQGALLGIGAAVKQGVRIGMWSVVGAGAVVVDDVPDNAVVVGVPARVYETRISGWHE